MAHKFTRVTWLSGAMALLLSFFVVAGVAAETGTASVSGSVNDAQGSVVAGATVRLVNATKGFSRTTTTNDNGLYSFTSVPPDSYRIEIEAQGFKKLVISKVEALVDQPKETNATLEAGNISEVVNVESGGLESVVNTTDASLGNNFVSQQILQLPLNARNVANLLSLQPGVTPDGYVAGGRSDQSNISLDGVDVNNQQQGTAFTPVVRVNPDSVEEFRVTTSNPDASKGRSSGAQISLITKSGKNEFHGVLYWYHRNTVTSANEWFNNAAGSFGPNDFLVATGQARAGDERVPRPKLLRNLFGGSVGGPVVKNRLFFFYNYEGMREAKNTSVVRQVPLPFLAQGNIRFADNTGVIWNVNAAQINSFTIVGEGNVVNINPRVQALFASAVARYPANDNSIGDGIHTSGYRFNAPTPVTQDGHTFRLDWNLTQNQTHLISFRGNYQQDVTGAAPYLPDTLPTNNWNHPIGMAVSHTWLLNNRMTNKVSYGFTRLAFSDQGDSLDPSITFRRIFAPTGFNRAFSRVNPTHNIVDDFSWVCGNHTFQFGGNIRLIENSRTSYARAFDTAITNASWYTGNPARVAVNQFIRLQLGQDPVTGTRSLASSWDLVTQDNVVALLGRLNDYGASYNFDTSGAPIPLNTGITRIFKTEEYDGYFQDVWKAKPNVTLTLGLRYGISMPVTETQGYETVPSIKLGEYLRLTEYYMQQGINYREPLSVRKAGKANGLDSIYPVDKNNLQPRIAVAWSPTFESGFWHTVFGGKSAESVLRGGFAITNDYFGQQLAVQWDGTNQLGFSSNAAINAGTYNITTNPGPEYTGPSVNIRTLPNLAAPTALTFPLTPAFNAPGSGRLERSLDQDLISPVNYSWNLTYGRRLPGNIWIDVSYIARLARNLLVGCDAMMLRGDIRDPISGMTFNEAATVLDRQLQSGVPVANIQPVAFFENMWAAGTLRQTGRFPCPAAIQATCTNTQAVYNGQPAAGDWTFMMTRLDGRTGTRYFFQGQYDALAMFSTTGSSDFHGGTLSIRQRARGITWDFNYTFSKSLDEASGLQTADQFTSFILDAFHPKAQRTVSDFDLTHVANFNGIWDIPIGRGRAFGNGMNKALNAILGGWQLSSVFRFNTGAPFFYRDSTGWQTNWNVRSYNVLLRPVETGTFQTAAAACASGCTLPNLFANPEEAWDSFRTPHPGETGTRNQVRLPYYYNVDAGLAKSFDMPWREGHKATIRWEVFNVLNHPIFSTQATALVGYTGSNAGGTFGRFTGTRTAARVMQFAFRYDF